MREQEIPVNPIILRWAREQTALPIEEIVSRANIKGISATKKRKPVSPAERLLMWESGEETPSLPQLRSLASAYRRPLITFFLSMPPRTEEKFKDYRTVGSIPTSRDTPEFAQLKRRIELLHEELVELQKEAGAPEVGFVRSVSLEFSATEAVFKAREALGLSFENQLCAKDHDNLLSVLRSKIQDAGAFVLFQSNLGNYHSDISVDEFRGMVISDAFAPLIVINTKDYKSAQAFSLMHEFAHLLLGETAVSNSACYTRVQHREIETFCNSFAAEFLIPSKELEGIDIITEENEAFKAAQLLTKKYKVSFMVASRRLRDLGKINNVLFDRLNSVAIQKFKDSKEKQKQKESGGVNRDVLDKHRLGKKVLNTILGATYEGRLSAYDASFLLGVSPNRFERVLGI